MSIQEKQNQHQSIEMLKAISFLYSRAKLFGTIRVIIAIVSVVISPFILVLVRNADFVVGFIGAVLTLVSELWLESIEDDLKQMAARVQEQFDTSLFALPWNEICTGHPVSPEVIVSSSGSYKGNYPFADWYPDTTDIPYPLDVLVCQRASLVWDWRLRQHFATGILLLSILWAIIVVLFGIYAKQDLNKYLFTMIFPALPAISQTIRAWRGHTKNAHEKQELEGIVANLWQKGIENPSTITVTQCRSLQDRIYNLRKEGPMVPDKWYISLRKKFEEDMHSSAAQLREEALQKYGPAGLGDK